MGTTKPISGNANATQALHAQQPAASATKPQDASQIDAKISAKEKQLKGLKGKKKTKLQKQINQLKSDKKNAASNNPAANGTPDANAPTGLAGSSTLSTNDLAAQRNADTFTPATNTASTMPVLNPTTPLVDMSAYKQPAAPDMSAYAQPAVATATPAPAMSLAAAPGVTPAAAPIMMPAAAAPVVPTGGFAQQLAAGGDPLVVNGNLGSGTGDGIKTDPGGAVRRGFAAF